LLFTSFHPIHKQYSAPRLSEELSDSNEEDGIDLAALKRMSVDLNDPEIARVRGELLDPSSATSWYV
jgi:hypothetical protein